MARETARRIVPVLERVAAKTRWRPVGGGFLAERIRGPQRDADGAGDFLGRDGAGRSAADGERSGLGLIGPTIIAYGTEGQKKRFIPKILSAEEIWCQGFSEPNAGSDLAGCRRKLGWMATTTLSTGRRCGPATAGFGDWCELVVRTDSQTCRSTRALRCCWLI